MTAFKACSPETFPEDWKIIFHFYYADGGCADEDTLGRDGFILEHKETKERIIVDYSNYEYSLSDSTLEEYEEFLHKKLTECITARQYLRGDFT